MGAGNKRDKAWWPGRGGLATLQGVGDQRWGLYSPSTHPPTHSPLRQG